MSAPSPGERPAAALTRFAPAKVNLFLHVGAIDDGGYHPISSLMAFADVGDRLTLELDAPMGLTVSGAFGQTLAAEMDNLVLRARDTLLAATSGGGRTFSLHLEKNLPIASGLGGGSSDAAATLALIDQALGLAVDPGFLNEIAAGLGSDVPACLNGAPAIATGRGERLRLLAGMPAIDAVLVNPGVGSATGRVFSAYDRSVSADGVDGPDWPGGDVRYGDFLRFLGSCRNDLEAPARGLVPEIGEVVRRLGQAPEARLVRMSGSGATCFALCEDRTAAVALADRLEIDEPTWWVRACQISGSAA